MPRREPRLDIRTTKYWSDVTRDVCIFSDYRIYYSSIFNPKLLVAHALVRNLTYIYLPKQTLTMVNTDAHGDIANPDSDILAANIDTRFNVRALLWRDVTWTMIKPIDVLLDPNIKTGVIYLYPAKLYLRELMEHFNVRTHSGVDSCNN